MNSNLQDAFRGCLIGGACGDALGYPVEFMRLKEIKKRFGPEGILKLEGKNGAAVISDDTQMTLFTRRRASGGRAEKGAAEQSPMAAGYVGASEGVEGYPEL